jgi:peptidoglycan/LPS O-acetylase OafA/YrhL
MRRVRGKHPAMNALLGIALPVAERSGSNSPDDGSGVLIIVAIVATLVVLAFLGHWLVDRFGQTKRKTLERDPQAPGRVGRVGKQEGP